MIKNRTNKVLYITRLNFKEITKDFQAEFKYSVCYKQIIYTPYKFKINIT